jgi:non-ribosomal peptide synthetase component F
MSTITAGQQKKLQTLYGQYARHTMDVSTTRAARLQWATERARRPISSFSELTLEEAKHLIDELQRVLGIAETSAPRRQRRRPMDARTAHAAGTAGRRDADHLEATMVGASDTARIQYVLGLLGWDAAGLTRFLQRATSPLKGRAEIRTLSDANKVYWALKGIATAKGVWKDAPGHRADLAARRTA